MELIVDPKTYNSKYFTFSDGRRMHYYEFCSNKSSEIDYCILIHGLTRNSKDNLPLAAKLAGTGYYRSVIAVDVVGRGLSDYFPTDQCSLYSYITYNTDLETFINHLLSNSTSKKLGVDCVGTSMGGIIGMYLASKCLLHKYVINDVGGTLPYSEIERIRHYVCGNYHNPIYNTVEGIRKVITESYSSFGDIIYTPEFTEISIKHLDNNKCRFDYDPNIAVPLLQHVNSNSKIDVNLQPLFSTIKLNCKPSTDIGKKKLLLIHGVESKLLTNDMITEMKNLLIPNNIDIEVYNVEKVGHAPVLIGDSISNLIIEYLTK